MFMEEIAFYRKKFERNIYKEGINLKICHYHGELYKFPPVSTSGSESGLVFSKEDSAERALS